jgi:hypothetical protein
MLEEFLKDFTTALDEGYAALFAGAGLSRPSGYVDWKELLRDVADDLGLSVDVETDLISLAQFHANVRQGRTRLNQLLVDEFTKDTKTTENHKLIANLPIRTVWTTNYDTLLENAFRASGKRPDVKFTQEQFSTTLPKRDVTIFKMHGDISQPADAVLIKEDYETYDLTRSGFSELLKGDLLKKTFVFMGFSFTDPNIDYILSRIRSLMGKNRRDHYCIMRRPQKPKGRGKALARYEYDRTKLELRIGDLRRYGIQALMIDDYDQITDILRELNKRSHRNNVFVSGSAREFGSVGQKRIEHLSRTLGHEIIRRGFNLTSGFGLGIGGAVIIGAMEALFEDETGGLDDRTRLRPFPQSAPRGMTLKQFWTRYREDMIANAGFVVFICGNKMESKRIVSADGVLEEFEIAKRLGKYPIPLGFTGYAAREIWEEVIGSLEEFYPGADVKRLFSTLGDANKSDSEIIDAVFGVMNRVVNKKQQRKIRKE